MIDRHRDPPRAFAGVVTTVADPRSGPALRSGALRCGFNTADAVRSVIRSQYASETEHLFLI